MTNHDTQWRSRRSVGREALSIAAVFAAYTVVAWAVVVGLVGVMP